VTLETVGQTENFKLLTPEGQSISGEDRRKICSNVFRTDSVTAIDQMERLGP
jgi:hypothetical protein